MMQNQIKNKAPQKSKQSGGTLLGLLIGLILGVAVALAVSIYTSKIPVPILQKKTAETDKNESEKLKNWNPNAPFTSGTIPPAGQQADKEIAKQSPQTPTKETEEQIQAIATRPLKPLKESKPEIPAPPATIQNNQANNGVSNNDDPIARMIASRTGQAGVAEFQYYVQAGAYRAEKDADGQRARLNLLGIQARLSKTEQAGMPIFRVRVGPFQNKNAADKVKERLESDGFDAALIRAPI